MTTETKIRVGAVVAIGAAVAFLLYKWKQFQLVISSGNTGVAGGGGGGGSTVPTEAATFWQWLLGGGTTSGAGDNSSQTTTGAGGSGPSGVGEVITAQPDGSTTSVYTGGATITGNSPGDSGPPS